MCAFHPVISVPSIPNGTQLFHSNIWTLVLMCSKVRSETAEYLYLMLQASDMEVDTDEIEELLLETEWYYIPLLGI